jgi:hypothetical protein
MGRASEEGGAMIAEALNLRARALAERHNLEVLWCPNRRTRRRQNGWSFPSAVERHLKEFTAGLSVVHLFGGLSSWGTRLDVDSITKPDVVGDAWLPPFKKDAFDVVILDPPYFAMNQQMKQHLLRGSGFVARKYVIWFHTQWIASDSHMRYERGWLVRVGDSCSVRCLQVFRAPTTKRVPTPFFTRGPAIRYNRWLGGQIPLTLPNSLELQKRISREAQR